MRNHASCLSNIVEDSWFSKSRTPIFFNVSSKPQFIETLELSQTQMLPRQGPALLTFGTRYLGISVGWKKGAESQGQYWHLLTHIPHVSIK